MPIYSARKLCALLVSGLVIGLVITGFVGLVAQSYFSTHLVRAYYQIISPGQPTSSAPTVQRWAGVNHTLVVLDARNVVSILTLTANETPYIRNNTVKIDFDDPYTYSSDDPVPTVLEGNRSWSGLIDRDLRIGQSVMILTRLRFDFDATYFVGGRVLSYASESNLLGYGTFFYVTVKNGEITSVTNELRQIPPSTQVDAGKLQP